MAGRRIPPRQQGAALLIFLILLVMAALTYYVQSLAPSLIEAQRTLRTNVALAQAREALLGYALQYRDQQSLKDSDSNGADDRAMYGYLPLPDLGSSRNNNIDPGCHKNPADLSSPELEGCDANTFTGATFDANGIGTTVVGRFPWRTLGTGPLRDGHGECLWLIVSSLHSRIQGANPMLPPMNWDTLGQLDIVVADGTSALANALNSTHDRPIAVIFSPGPPLSGQDRSRSTVDDVDQCGGNYNAANYLDRASAIGSIANYLAGTNAASGITGDSDISNDPDSPKSLLTRGNLYSTGSSYLAGGCSGAGCSIVANDIGQTLVGDVPCTTAGNCAMRTKKGLFDLIRNNDYFRTDINSLLDRMVDCLRDEIIAGGGPIGYGKIAGANSNACYGEDIVPLGYYPHYREMIFAARGAMTVNGQSCAAALLFGSQRRGPIKDASGNTITPAQARDSATNRASATNYLEEINIASWGAGTTFSGPERFACVSPTQSAFQDIARCIPATPSLATVESTALTAAGLPQLASYNVSTRTLTLGREVTSAIDSSLASDLYGCAWRSEVHPMGSGLRSYFTFRINDAGFSSTPTEGFTFSIVDGDNNGIGACGAAAQHLGYSGNNLDTPTIAPPKIALEIDPRTSRNAHPTLPNFYFDETDSDTLANGRNDPLTIDTAPDPDVVLYRGGHVALAYWGGETSIATGGIAPCASPRVAVGGFCYLLPEEDDNVHGKSVSSRTGFPEPPANPPAPAIPLSVPPDAPAGVYKLDPNRSSIPVNQDFHVRVELTRFTTRYTPATVRVATTANLNIAAPDAIIDNVTLLNNDRVLVMNQTTSSENGVYVWNGPSVAMTRATDADSSLEISDLVIEVREGDANALTLWRQTISNPVLGSDALVWSQRPRTASASPLPTARVATISNIGIASPGTTIDGVHLSAGDRVLVKDQSLASENGLYVWNGSTSAMTRATDADTAAEIAGLVVEIQQGTQNALTLWRQSATNITLGATSLRWGNARVKIATSANINLAAPGAILDDVMMQAGDRVLVKAQATAADNGIYVWNGSTSAMTRATDADTSAKLAGYAVQVKQGSQASAWWRYNDTVLAWQRLSVTIATQTNINLASPGPIIDGVTLAVGDRVLVKAQYITKENGIYVWNGAAVAMTRAGDADSSSALAGALTQVIVGSDIGRAYRQSALAASGTLETDSVTWSAIDASTGYKLEVWILPGSPTSANQIAAMKNTTRPMSLIYPGFPPQLRDTPIIPHSFRNVRLGFTTAQRLSITDQTTSISNSFTTWLD